MKTFVLGYCILLSFNLNAQKMKSPQDVVIELFVATDQRNWDLVEKSFHTTVNLDYSSMHGQPASALAPAQIIDAWKSVLPGFEATHHQLGNFQVSVEDDAAHVFCYVTASHYLEDEKGSLWVVVGTYDFDLIQDPSDNWKISDMKLNFKYQDGNTALPEKARQK